jgi:hypothetical protein
MDEDIKKVELFECLEFAHAFDIRRTGQGRVSSPERKPAVFHLCFTDGRVIENDTQVLPSYCVRLYNSEPICTYGQKISIHLNIDGIIRPG